MKILAIPITDRRRIFELAAVVITASGKFLFMDILQWRLPFILCTLVAWSVYAYARSKSHSTMLQHWGFRKDNFKKVLRILFPFASVAVIACLVTGYVRGTLNLTWHIIPILIVYPIWGTIQQFLCVGLVAGNLQDMNKPLKTKWIVLVAAVLFSVLHYPNPWLMMGTFILALLYTIVYLRERNLYALGLFHGWLGALFYYTVVGRDPFMEVFGQIAK